MIATANEAMKKGEKTRILFEVLMEHLELEMTEEVQLEEIFNKLKQHQDEYNEGVKMLALVMQKAQKAKAQQNSNGKAFTLHEQMERHQEEE